MLQIVSLLLLFTLPASSLAVLQDPPVLEKEDPYVFPEEGPGELTVVYHENGKKAREGKLWKGRRHGLWRGVAHRIILHCDVRSIDDRARHQVLGC